MALSPPSNTDMATQQDVEHAQAHMSAQLVAAKGELKAEIERMGSRTLRWTVVSRCSAGTPPSSASSGS